MEKYNELLNVVNDFLSQEEIVAKANIVSAYHFKEIIMNILEKINYFKYGTKCQKMINEEMNKNLSKRKEAIAVYKSKAFDGIKSTKVSLLVSSLFNKKKRFSANEGFYSLSNTIIKSDRTIINVNYYTRSLPVASYSISLVKEHNSNLIYFDTGFIDHHLLEDNYDLFSELFKIAEEYSSLFEGYELLEKREIISNFWIPEDPFLIKFSLDTYGNLTSNIELPKYNSLFYSTRFYIDFETNRIEASVNGPEDIINKININEILKRIPVNISKLNGVFGKIVEEYFNKPEKVLGKKLGE